MALVVVKSKSVKYLALIGINLIYACTSICTKMASRQELLSWPYFFLDSWCHRRNGLVCFIMAAGHRKDAAFHGLYVQGDKLDFCAADFSIAIW